MLLDVFRLCKSYLGILFFFLTISLVERNLSVGCPNTPWQPLKGEKPKMPLLRTLNPWELRYLERWVQIMYMSVEQDDVWVTRCWGTRLLWDTGAAWLLLTLHLSRIPQPTCNANLIKWIIRKVMITGITPFSVLQHSSCSVHGIEPILGIAKLIKSL